MDAKCRNCGAKYDPMKTKAEYRGYCTQRCLQDKAKELAGHEVKTTVERGQVLRAAGQLGDISYEAAQKLPGTEANTAWLALALKTSELAAEYQRMGLMAMAHDVQRIADDLARRASRPTQPK